MDGFNVRHFVGPSLYPVFCRRISSTCARFAPATNTCFLRLFSPDTILTAATGTFKRSARQTQLTLRAPYLDNEVVRTVFRAPRVEQGDDVRLRLIRDGSPALARLRTDRGVGRAQPTSRRRWASLFEFMFKAEYAYDYGMPQWVAKVDHAFAPLHLERLWMGRHKLFHFRWWYRTILATYVQEMLLDPRTLARPYLEKKVVETVVRGHLKGDRNYTTEIHRLLSLELFTASSLIAKVCSRKLPSCRWPQSLGESSQFDRSRRARSRRAR